MQLLTLYTKCFAVIQAHTHSQIAFVFTISYQQNVCVGLPHDGEAALRAVGDQLDMAFSGFFIGRAEFSNAISRQRPLHLGTHKKNYIHISTSNQRVWAEGGTWRGTALQTQHTHAFVTYTLAFYSPSKSGYNSCTS